MIPFPDLGKVNALEREQPLASLARMLIRDTFRVRRVTASQYSGTRVFRSGVQFCFDSTMASDA